MADLTTLEAPSGLGQITFTAAAAGGDTVEIGASVSVGAIQFGPAFP